MPSGMLCTAMAMMSGIPLETSAGAGTSRIGRETGPHAPHVRNFFMRAAHGAEQKCCTPDALKNRRQRLAEKAERVSHTSRHTFQASQVHAHALRKVVHAVVPGKDMGNVLIVFK